MLTIGKVAQRAGTSVDSVRYYEREGLLEPAARSQASYRLYTADVIRRIGFIKQAQECGFSLAEIRELLGLRGTDQACCNDIYRVAAQKKAELDHKIDALLAMAGALARLIEMCSRDRKSLAECPILGALEAGAAEGNGNAQYSRVKVPGTSRRKLRVKRQARQ
jgi:MerR family Zn(II)-responsive transcriptional regulator of zntA